MTDDTKKDTAKEEKADKKAVSKSVTKLVDEISKLSVLELSNLVNELQEVLGVSAMPMAAAAPASAPAADAGADEDAGGGTVVITGLADPAKKIAVIKAIREIDQNVTLPDAKKMTEEVPAEVLKDAKPEDAKAAAEKLKTAGAKVEVK